MVVEAAPEGVPALDAAAETLAVRPLHQPIRSRNLALAGLLEELNRTGVRRPGSGLRLVYELPPAEFTGL